MFLDGLDGDRRVCEPCARHHSHGSHVAAASHCALARSSEVRRTGRTESSGPMRHVRTAHCVASRTTARILVSHLAAVHASDADGDPEIVRKPHEARAYEERSPGPM